MSDRSNNRRFFAPEIIPGSKVGDSDQAVDILQELHAILKKHGCILIHEPNGMLLGKVPPGLGSTVRALAVVKLIAPDHFIWCNIDWTGDGIMKPGEFKVN